MDQPTIAVTTFDNIFQTHPAKVEYLTIEALQEKFLQMRHLVLSSKDKAPAFIIAKLDGQGRKKENIETVNAIVLDLDVRHEDEVIQQAVGQLTSFAYIIYTTYSHTAVDSRYRFVIPLMYPVSPEKFERENYALRLASMLNLKVDSCSAKATQCYYVPSRPVDSAPEDHAIVVGTSTTLFDAKNLPAKAAKPAAKGSNRIEEEDAVIPASYTAVAQLIEKMFDGIAPIFAGGKFHIYSNGLWEALPSNNALVRDLIVVHDKKLSIANAKRLVATMCVLHLEDTFPEANTDKITLLNGTLNLKNGRLLKHHPHNYHRSGMDFDYAPLASCARWLQYLNEVFANDLDKQQKIDFVQEMLGYLLIPSTQFQVMFWLYGAGANGKSVLTHLIRKLLGEQNVSSV